ncbi:citramalate synthase, partial [archaeon]|nr:citramalate synthase [archaeon]
YIEGGWPGSNPRDIEFFKKAKKLKLKHAELVAFGSTRKAKEKANNDRNLKALLDSGTKTICIFGKSWDLHVKDALRVPLKENLKMIEDSVEYLKSKDRKVIYDAEHFFDAYESNPEYAMETLEVAQEAGADCLVLCDTNGGTLPGGVHVIVEKVKEKMKAPLGIHAHNDSDVAVANSTIAVRRGVTHVQGTINGMGERCGNANLCSVIPNLKIKMGINCVTDKQLKKLAEISRFVNEIANIRSQHNMPYVGRSAFAHKGGIHVDAVLKKPRTYEHTDPELVGNARRILVSELAGKSTVLRKAEEYGLNLKKSTPETKEILKKLKEMESEGYQFEGAEASFELLVKKTLGVYKSFFNLEGFRVTVDARDDELIAEATVKVKVGKKYEHTAAEGEGPVNALDNALRKALEKFYPVLHDVRLTDYKVRVLDEKSGTGAKVRVLIQTTDGKSTWGTVGVSENIIEASLLALADSIDYKLLKESET